MEAKQLTPGCLEVRFARDGAFEKWFMLCSDVHFDNPHCDRELFYSHLDQAKERNAKVMIFGDFFCFMQGKYDPRRAKSNVRPEHNFDNYIDRVIMDTAEKLEPWKDNLLFISKGNHERSILRNCETDVLDRFIMIYNSKGGEVYKGTYGGFIRFVSNRVAGGKINHVRSLKMYYHHGKWGGMVSKGTQSSNRYASIAPDANIVVSGHNHENWYMSFPQFRLKENGEIKVEEQVHLKCGTYKEEFEDLDGWATERIVIPKSKKAWWLRLYGNSKNLEFSVMPT